MTIQDLIRARGAIKSKLTVFSKLVENYNESQGLSILRISYQKFRPEIENYERVQSELEKICSEADYAGHLKDREEFENKSLTYMGKAEDILRAQPDANSLLANGQNPVTAAADVSQNAIAQINFPRLELPKFDGTLEDWPEFSDVFLATVHNDKRFTNVQKLIYLRSCLTGQAAAKIQSLPTTDANYAVACSLLQKSYNDPQLLIRNHVQAFFELPLIVRASAAAIGENLDIMRVHYRALQALKTPFLEAFPIYCSISKLDKETREKWREVNQKTTSATMEDLIDFLDNRQKILQDPSDTRDNKSSNKNPQNSAQLSRRQSPKENFQSKRTFSTTFSAQLNNHCNICQGEHYTQNCTDFLNLTVDERIKTIEENKLCFNCLRSNHFSNKCRASTCKTCGERHHTLIHKEKTATQQVNVARSIESNHTQVLLSTAVITFIGINGAEHKVRALLDSGSQTNFISANVVKKLRLNERKVNLQVTGINGMITTYNRETNARIKSRNNSFTAMLPFIVREKFTDLTPQFRVNQTKLDVPTNLNLADPRFYEPGEIDALLGAAIFYKILSPKQKYLNCPNTVLQKSQFGWIVAGEVPIEPTRVPLFCNLVTENCITEQLDDQLNKFWELERVAPANTLSPEENYCENHYQQNTTRELTTGKYIVKLPFRDNKGDLGSSYDTTLKRYLSLERSLNKNSDLKKQYDDFLKEYKTLEHMTECEQSRNLNYLPHHGVIKASSLTTKLRVVFDASAKTTSGLSLNDVLHVGPVIQEDLFSIVTRFRFHSYVLTADITKMYRQIILHPDDRKYQNILWRNDIDNKIKTYQLNTLTYGTGPASFLATRTLHRLADDEADSLPLAARVLKRDFYVDDLLTGASSISEAGKLRDEILELTKRGGLPLRQWASNEPKLIDGLLDNEEKHHVSLYTRETIKTLGIHWNALNDNIIYIVDNTQMNEQITKRTILSQIARLFDPLGLLAPVIIRAKIMMQRLWQTKIG